MVFPTALIPVDWGGVPPRGGIRGIPPAKMWYHPKGFLSNPAARAMAECGLYPCERLGGIVIVTGLTEYVRGAGPEPTQPAPHLPSHAPALYYPGLLGSQPAAPPSGSGIDVEVDSDASTICDPEPTPPALRHFALGADAWCDADAVLDRRIGADCGTGAADSFARLRAAVVNVYCTLISEGHIILKVYFGKHALYIVHGSYHLDRNRRRRLKKTGRDSGGLPVGASPSQFGKLSSYHANSLRRARGYKHEQERTASDGGKTMYFILGYYKDQNLALDGESYLQMEKVYNVRCVNVDPICERPETFPPGCQGPKARRGDAYAVYARVTVQ